MHTQENLFLQPFVRRAHEKGNVVDGGHAHRSVMSGLFPSGSCFHEGDRETFHIYQGALGGNDARPGAVTSLVYHVLLNAAVSY